MNEKNAFGDAGRTVYIREVAAATLPRDVQDQVPDGATLYAVHDTDGERLALVNDRRLAFQLARQNELSPVSVH